MFVNYKWVLCASLGAMIGLLVFVHTLRAGCIQTCREITAWGQNQICKTVTDRPYCNCTCQGADPNEAYRISGSANFHCVDDQSSPGTFMVFNVNCPDTRCSELAAGTCQELVAPSVNFTTFQTSTECVFSGG